MSALGLQAGGIVLETGLGVGLQKDLSNVGCPVASRQNLVEQEAARAILARVSRISRAAI